MKPTDTYSRFQVPKMNDSRFQVPKMSKSFAQLHQRNCFLSKIQYYEGIS